MNKYELYRRAVQDPPATVDFLENVFRELSRGKPRRLREDFCGTFALSCEWVLRGESRSAMGIDKDSKPLTYGKKNPFGELTPHHRRRISLRRGDLKKIRLPSADLACALNFSALGLKKRDELMSYFKRCRSSLLPRGVFVMDCLPGSEAVSPVDERVEYAGFTYLWKQAKFNPFTREVIYHIFFQQASKGKQTKAFTYDWRLWTVPELRDALFEAGFRKVEIYANGVHRVGLGTKGWGRADDSGSWVAYLAALA